MCYLCPPTLLPGHFPSSVALRDVRLDTEDKDSSEGPEHELHGASVPVQELSCGQDVSGLYAKQTRPQNIAEVLLYEKKNYALQRLSYKHICASFEQHALTL